MRPTLNILSDDLITQILDEAKRFLAETGMEIRGSAMRQRLLDHGLSLDSSGERVLFSEDVVDAAIASTPKSFTLFDRHGSPYTEIGGDKVHFVPGSSGLKVLDHRTGETRLANTTDFTEYVRICDGLTSIPYPSTAFSTNDDIEAQVSDAWRLYICLTNTRRPVVSGAFSEHGVPRMADMMQLFREDAADLIARPMSIFTITATGNFRYGEDSCQNILDCADRGIPVEIVPVTLQGLIAPVTLVGATAFHTIDVLAGLTMAQIAREGTPVIFGGAPATFHMKAASAPMAAIEALHLDTAYVAVAKSLDLPTQAYMALSDAKLLDAQAGAETFGSALLAALAGVNSVSGPGMLDFLLVSSLAKLVFDDEMCGQALHFVREIRPLDDLPVTRLAEELMAENHLITSDHTLEHWPQEFHLTSPIVDRENRETWIRRGGKELPERANDEVEHRLAKYEPLETDDALVAELEHLIMSGFESQEELPDVPPPAQGTTARSTNKRRRRRRTPRG